MKIGFLVNFLNTTSIINSIKNNISKTKLFYNAMKKQPLSGTNFICSDKDIINENKNEKNNDKPLFKNQNTKKFTNLIDHISFDNNMLNNIPSSFLKIVFVSMDCSNPKNYKIENSYERLCKIMISNSFLFKITNKTLLLTTFENIINELKDSKSQLNLELNNYKIKIDTENVIEIFKNLIDGLNSNRLDKLDRLNLLKFVVCNKITNEIREENCKAIFNLLNVTTEIYNLYLHLFIKKERKAYLFNVYEFNETKYLINIKSSKVFVSKLNF